MSDLLSAVGTKKDRELERDADVASLAKLQQALLQLSQSTRVRGEKESAFRTIEAIVDLQQELAERDAQAQNSCSLSLSISASSFASDSSSGEEDEGEKEENTVGSKVNLLFPEEEDDGEVEAGGVQDLSGSEADADAVFVDLVAYCVAVPVHPNNMDRRQRSRSPMRAAGARTASIEERKMAILDQALEHTDSQEEQRRGREPESEIALESLAGIQSSLGTVTTALPQAIASPPRPRFEVRSETQEEIGQNMQICGSTEDDWSATAAISPRRDKHRPVHNSHRARKSRKKGGSGSESTFSLLHLTLLLLVALVGYLGGQSGTGTFMSISRIERLGMSGAASFQVGASHCITGIRGLTEAARAAYISITPSRHANKSNASGDRELSKVTKSMPVLLTTSGAPQSDVKLATQVSVSPGVHASSFGDAHNAHFWICAAPSPAALITPTNTNTKGVGEKWHQEFAARVKKVVRACDTVGRSLLEKAALEKGKRMRNTPRYLDRLFSFLDRFAMMWLLNGVHWLESRSSLRLSREIFGV